MLFRHRTDDDLDASERLAFAVHEVDGYPVHIPADMRKFLVAPDELTAWVAELDGEVVGHVALHPRCSQPLTDVVRGEMRPWPGRRYGVVVCSYRSAGRQASRHRAEAVLMQPGR